MTNKEFEKLRADTRLQNRIEYLVDEFYPSRSKRYPDEEPGDHERYMELCYAESIEEPGSAWHTRFSQTYRCREDPIVRAFSIVGIGSEEALTGSCWERVRAGKPGQLNTYYVNAARWHLLDLLRRADTIRRRSFVRWVEDSAGTGRLGGYYRLRQHQSLASAVRRKKLPDSWQE